MKLGNYIINAILFVLICIALFIIIQWSYNWYTGVWA